MEIIQCQNMQEAKVRAGELLCAFLMDAKKHSRAVLLLLSGGSAFSVLDMACKDALGSYVTIGMLDERFSRDETSNNFAQLTKTSFYANACAVGALFIDTRIRKEETQNNLAARFENTLRDWVKAHSDGVIIATMGIGTDGHTAGIMPFPEDPVLFRQLFEDEVKWVASYDAGDKNPHPLRITVSLPFLREQVAGAIVFVVGEEKQNTVRRVLAEEGTLAKTPARVIHEMKNVHLFTSLALKKF